jgi:tRNA-specific 2-thiouridylase
MAVVAVAISGGVDSLVAAFLLREKGHDVFGYHFRTGYESIDTAGKGTSPRLADIDNISGQLAIPIEVLDLSQLFRESVVAYFTEAYQDGRTPNPCLYCNPTIKFGHLLTHVRQKGAEALATGHYARLETTPDGRCHLYRGVDARKDQSYFLSRLTPQQLRHACFPLGGLTKEAVCAIARENHLTPTTRGESQDICFIKNAPYHEFLQKQEGFEPCAGPIVDTQGRLLGHHQGLHQFTVGQRRGINCPAAEPYYVIRIDHRHNRLVVGHRNELYRETCTVEDVNWITRPEPFPADVMTQIRYRHQSAPSRLSGISAHAVQVTFDHPQKAVTPGQGAVFYRNNEVLGGGWIA